MRLSPSCASTPGLAVLWGLSLCGKIWAVGRRGWSLCTMSWTQKDTRASRPWTSTMWWVWGCCMVCWKGLTRQLSGSPFTAILAAFGLPASTMGNNPRTETALMWFGKTTCSGKMTPLLAMLLYFIVRNHLHNVSSQDSCPFPPRNSLWYSLPPPSLPFPSAPWPVTRAPAAAVAASSMP